MAPIGDKMFGKYIRQTAFILTGTLFRLPILGILWILGKLHLIKIIFQVYPTDESEIQGFCPNIKLLRNFFSTRPTFGGFIADGMRPIGFYVVVPNTAQDLIKRTNAKLAHSITRRLLWIQQLTGAFSIGLAGQLGFIFEKRHGIPIQPPLYNSLYGALFSLSETIFQAIKKHNLSPDSAIIGILGMGVFGDALRHFLEEKGYHAMPINLQYTKSGRLKIRDEEAAVDRIKSLNMLVNITPTGTHFLQTNIHTYLVPNCIIIDFSRPGIPPTISNTVYRGNRVQRKGIRFILSLPGDWDHYHIPACSLASLLATRQQPTWETVDDFCKTAKENRYFISLEGTC